MPFFGQVAWQQPQPLQAVSLVSTTFLTPPCHAYSSRVIALNGQVSTQYAHPSQFSSRTSEMAASSARLSCARVHRLWVSIGELAGVEIDLLRTAYDIYRDRTVCDGVPLEVTPVAARWTCSRCEHEVGREGPLRCPGCGAPARLAQGGEILLDRIEMEVP